MKNNYGNLLVNQNPNSQDYGKALALHWVIKMGADCDGYDSGIRITSFGCADLAKKYCDTCNWWSDGVKYFILSDVRDLVGFCNEYGISFKNYLYVNAFDDQNSLLKYLGEYYANNEDDFNEFYFNNQINLTDYSNPEL